MVIANLDADKHRDLAEKLVHFPSLSFNCVLAICSCDLLYDRMLACLEVCDFIKFNVLILKCDGLLVGMA